MLLYKKFIKRKNIFINLLHLRTSTTRMSSEDNLVLLVKNIVPSLIESKHKGQDGRIGVVGGSLEFTGAPFYSGITALKTGADLVHIFCCKAAGSPIKSYSPELMVHPVLDEENALSKIEPWLERLHVILIGPGLGRDEETFKTVTQLITLCRQKSKPLVIDADGLFLIGQNPELIRNYPDLVLTPNAMEFSRLVKAFLNKDISPTPLVDTSLVKELAKSIGEGTMIIRKGVSDVIADGNKDTQVISCGVSGSGRRCGGQGDLLAGATAVFTYWAKSHSSLAGKPTQKMIAGYGACRMTRECNAAAFKIKHRSMLVTDMIPEIGNVFNKFFES